MQKPILPALALSFLALSACGSPEPQGPTEQIVVREPGEPVPATDAPAATSGIDLATAGATAFDANCAACHSLDAGEGSGIGPNLHGVIGRAAGSLEDFAYSDAMAASDITWTTSEIEPYIANPVAKVPGTSMAGIMITDPEDRSAITAYLANEVSE